MVLFKTEDIGKFITRIEFLENIELRFPIIWQSFYDGTTFSILVGKE